MGSNLEHDEQVLFVRDFEERWPELRIMAIPNGARTSSIRQAVKLKAEGLRAGVPDLYVPALNLWIEMKKPGGKLSSRQKDWIEYLQSIGHRVIVAFGARDAMGKVLQAMQ